MNINPEVTQIYVRAPSRVKKYSAFAEAPFPKDTNRISSTYLFGFTNTAKLDVVVSPWVQGSVVVPIVRLVITNLERGWQGSLVELSSDVLIL